MNSKKRSEKFIKVRDKLPEELREIYTQLVDEYAYHAHLLYGKDWVAYDVLAELIKAGWHMPKRTNNTK